MNHLVDRLTVQGQRHRLERYRYIPPHEHQWIPRWYHVSLSERPYYLPGGSGGLKVVLDCNICGKWTLPPEHRSV